MPPRLEVGAVRARGNLTISALRRQPDFQVVGLGSGKTHVARAQQDAAVRQLELSRARLRRSAVMRSCSPKLSTGVEIVTSSTFSN
jgi:hypothetical protein